MTYLLPAALKAAGYGLLIVAPLPGRSKIIPGLTWGDLCSRAAYFTLVSVPPNTSVTFPKTLR